MDSNDIHAKLIVFFAKRLVEIEARQRALEVTLAQVCKVDTAYLAHELAGQLVASRITVGSQFLSDLENDPELAPLLSEASEWLN